MPPPPPRRSGTGWKIAVVVLTLLLGFSMLIHLGQFLSAILESADEYAHSAIPLEEVMFKDNHSTDKIAIVPIEGLIFGGSLGRGSDLVQWIRDQLDTAGHDPHVKAVLLRVNSPGGEVLASDEINQAIAAFQKEHQKPVVATLESVAASGGYYVAVACRWIVANELTITGSIGVIMQSYNYRALMDKIGLRPEVFKSGKFKDMLSSDKKESEITQEERDMIQRLVDQTFGRFKQVVADGRAKARESNQNHNATRDKGKALAEDWSNLADGRILSGREAFETGFVDELGNFDAAVRRAESIAGVEDANLVEYRRIFAFGDFLRLFSKTETHRTLKIDWGLEALQLRPGQPYFLSPTFVR